MDVRMSFDVNQAQEVFTWLWQTNKSFRDNCEIAFGMVVGGDHQWDQADLMKLDEENRPHVSLNIVQSKINTVYGFETQNRTGMRGVGIGDEDDVLGMIASGILKFERRRNKLDYLFSRVFKDEAICGRGWVDLNVKRGSDFLMENVAKRGNTYNIFKDPRGETTNGDDWNALARSEWFTFDELKKMFPGQLKGIAEINELRREGFGVDEEITTGTDRSERGGDYGTDNNIFSDVFERTFLDKEQNRAAIGELWTAENQDTYYILNNYDGRSIRIGSDKDKVEEAKKRTAQVNRANENNDNFQRFKLSSKPERIIMHDMFVGDIHLVEHEINPFNHNQWPLVLASGYMERVGNKIEEYGIVANMLDPQREKNRYHSLGLDILGRAPKGGGVFKQNAKNATAVKNFSETGGWHGVPNPNDFVPFKAEFIGALAAVQGYELNAKIDAEDISGINKSMEGFQQGSKESGVLARTRIRQGTLGLMELFDHHDEMKYQVAKMMVENVRQYWTLQKVVLTMGEVPGLENDEQVQATAEFLKDDDVMKYDVEIDEGDNSISVRAANFASMIEALQFGMPIPPQSVIEASPWPNKKQMLADMQQQQQNEALANMVQNTVTKGTQNG